MKKVKEKKHLTNQFPQFNDCFLFNAGNLHLTHSQNLEVGAQVKIIGRVQSRQYEKKYEDGTSEMKVAYEVSICSLELINEEGTENKEETENQEAV